MKAHLYLGWFRTTIRKIHINKRDVSNGYVKVPCPECLGTGWWAFMEPEIPGRPCVDCKGSGNIYVNC